MRNSKLVLLIKSLSEKEFKEYGKFINSPYFNSNKKVVALYNFIEKLYPELDGKKIEKEYVGRKILKDGFDRHKMNKLMSEMAKLIQQFIAIQTFESNQTIMMYAEAIWYSNKNMLQSFHNTGSKIENSTDEEIKFSGFNYLVSFLLSLKKYSHPFFSNQSSTGKKLLEANKDLERYYILSKLKLIFELQERKRITKEDTSLQMSSAEENLAKKYADDPLISIYYDLISLHKKRDLNLILSTQTKFILKIDQFLKLEKLAIIHALINHLSNIYHSGHPDLVYDILELFKLGIDQGIFIHADKIRHTTFLNICVTAAAASDFVFLYKFLADYKKYIDLSIQEMTINLGQAYSLFHKKEFDKALQYLSVVPNSKMPEFGLRIRNLDIRCIYEITVRDRKFSDRELLEDKIKAFEKYLQRRDKISENMIMRYKNFVQFVKKLFRNESKEQNEFKRKLLKNLNSKKYIVSVTWLREKIKEGNFPP